MAKDFDIHLHTRLTAGDLLLSTIPFSAFEKMEYFLILNRPLIDFIRQSDGEHLKLLLKESVEKYEKLTNTLILSYKNEGNLKKGYEATYQFLVNESGETLYDSRGNPLIVDYHAMILNAINEGSLKITYLENDIPSIMTISCSVPLIAIGIPEKTMDLVHTVLTDGHGEAILDEYGRPILLDSTELTDEFGNPLLDRNGNPLLTDAIEWVDHMGIVIDSYNNGTLKKDCEKSVDIVYRALEDENGNALLNEKGDFIFAGVVLESWAIELRSEIDGGSAQKTAGGKNVLILSTGVLEKAHLYARSDEDPLVIDATANAHTGRYRLLSDLDGFWEITDENGNELLTEDGQPIGTDTCALYNEDGEELLTEDGDPLLLCDNTTLSNLDDMTLSEMDYILYN